MGLDMSIYKNDRTNEIKYFRKFWSLWFWFHDTIPIEKDKGYGSFKLSKRVVHKLIKEINIVLADNSLADQYFPIRTMDKCSNLFPAHNEYFFECLRGLRDTIKEELKNDKHTKFIYWYWY
jgi:hypothetical protein